MGAVDGQELAFNDVRGRPTLGEVLDLLGLQDAVPLVGEVSLDS